MSSMLEIQVYSEGQQVSSDDIMKRLTPAPGASKRKQEEIDRRRREVARSTYIARRELDAILQQLDLSPEELEEIESDLK